MGNMLGIVLGILLLFISEVGISFSTVNQGSDIKSKEALKRAVCYFARDLFLAALIARLLN